MSRLNKTQELSAMMGGVDLLAQRMKEKLRRKARKGYSGGLDHKNLSKVASKLREHLRLLYLEPHQAIDVCNLVMMLWVMAGSPDR